MVQLYQSINKIIFIFHSVTKRKRICTEDGRSPTHVNFKLAYIYIENK